MSVTALEAADKLNLELAGLDMDITEIGLGTELSADIPIEVWLAATSGIIRINKSVQWVVGDLLNYGETRYGEDYSQVAEISGYSETSLPTLKWVASKIEYERRWSELDWSHHRLVADLDPDEQDTWLQRAFDGEWSVRKLGAELKAAEGILDPDSPRKPRKLVSDIETQAYHLVEVVGIAGDETPDLVSESRELLPNVWTAIDALAEVSETEDE